nr:hypothetical protein [Hymenobacter rigui]
MKGGYLWGLFCLQLYQFYPTVFSPAFFGSVISYWLGLPEASGLQSVCSNTRFGKRCHYTLRPGGRKLLVVRGGAGIIGVALHGQAQLRVLLQQCKYLGYRSRRFGPNDGFIRVEVDIQGYLAFCI